jgi:uncharacterized membrane protein YraQ (UPF0718 family)
MIDTVLSWLGNMLTSGWQTLLDYLGAHVLLCLLPAFLIAGYMSAILPKESVTRYLGPKVPAWISYPAAALGGFLLAVCSCTILPLFAGIWKRGAGLGPAITFLFVGPAVNILAISYTGAAIGMDIAIARIVLSIVFGIAIGIGMAWLFRTEKQKNISDESPALFNQPGASPRRGWASFLLLIALLLAGTFQVPLLRDTWFEIPLGLELSPIMQSVLANLDLDLQGAFLILLLILLGTVAAKGLESVLKGFNRWTYLTLGLLALTLLMAGPNLSTNSLAIGVNGRFLAILFILIAGSLNIYRHLSQDQLSSWLWETWRFVKQIFPLLIVGVFLAGVLKALIPEEWVQYLAGRNTLLANGIGVFFGVFMYFPTLVEVPIARLFLDLGMHRGPLLAYLLADPELSLQSILVTGKILGRRKTTAYVGLVSVASILAGYLFGLILSAL